jgi:predicted XRE-type DNA-binding protein
MNFSQLHEQLRLEVVRRIERGSLDQTTLARKIGMTRPHISNFLNKKCRFSLAALDKLLETQMMTVADLVPVNQARSFSNRQVANGVVPLVSKEVIAMNARIGPESILKKLQVDANDLLKLRARCSAQRRMHWDRFLAVAVSEEDAAAMPILPKNSIVLIDRHYNSAVPYARDGRTIYAVGFGGRLKFRYAAVVRGQLVLTAQNPVLIPELVLGGERLNFSDLLIGRVFRTISDH